MARGEREYAARVHKVRDLWIAIALAVLGGAASLAPAIAGKPFFGYASALLMIAASRVCHSGFGKRVDGGVVRTFATHAGVEALLASRSLAVLASSNLGAGGSVGDGHRHDNVGRHHGRQLSSDRASLDGQSTQG